MQINLPANGLYIPDYDQEKARCIEFIKSFADQRLHDDTVHGKLKYMRALQRVANKESKLIELELDDIKEYFSAQKDAHFIERIQRNTATYVSIFSEVIDHNMPQPTVNFKEEDLSTFDVLME